MDFKQVNQSSENSTISSSLNDSSKSFLPSKFPPHTDPLQHQKWEVQTSLGYDTRIGQPFSQFQPPKDSPSPQAFNPDHMTKRPDLSNTSQIQDSLQSWDPHLMLSNLSFLEQKIHQVQDIIHSITNREGWFEDPSNELIAHQQLVTADITSIIIQLISTAGALLPSTKNAIFGANPLIQQLGNITGNPTSASVAMNIDLPQHKNVAMGRTDDADYDDQIKVTLNSSGTEGNYMNSMDRVGPTEEHDVKDYEDTTEGENLPPGSYEVLQLEKEEILAPHTHFCSICGKGFKRDANLRMHMRGHGDEYKTPAALSKPAKDLNSEPLIVKRYSCPYLGCKRNKDHKKFQPLKTILCVKNHYKRSHCDKSYTCSRCNSKRFSVLADLKTHEKHCGRDKWLCSCGTTFSRKDKLFGHVALFQGHSPVLTVDELKGWSGALDQGQGTEGKELDFGSSSISSRGQVLDMKGDEDHGYFSTMNFDTCNFGGIHELSLPGFEISESSFSFIHSGSCNFVQKNGEN